MFSRPDLIRVPANLAHCLHRQSALIPPDSLTLSGQSVLTLPDLLTLNGWRREIRAATTLSNHCVTLTCYQLATRSPNDSVTLTAICHRRF